jgi:hypothetical protein
MRRCFIRTSAATVEAISLALLRMPSSSLRRDAASTIRMAAMKIMAKQCEGLEQSPAASAGTISILLEYVQAILSTLAAVSPAIAKDALHAFLFDCHFAHCETCDEHIPRSIEDMKCQACLRQAQYPY